MVTIFLFAFIGVIITGIVKGKSYYDKFYYYFISPYWFILFMCIFGNITGLLLPSKTYIDKTEYKLISFQDNNGIKGSFILGSGDIEGKMRYSFYYENEDKYIMLKELDCSDVKIKIIDDNTEPYIEICNVEKVEGSLINYFSIRSFMLYEYYVINIPKNGIKMDYSLDGK